jgi:TolA-binding protein
MSKLEHKLTPPTTDFEKYCFSQAYAKVLKNQLEYSRRKIEELEQEIEDQNKIKKQLTDLQRKYQVLNDKYSVAVHINKRKRR